MKACLPSKPMYCSREYQASTGLIQQYEKSTSKIGEALIENVIMKYCIPEYIIMDQDSAFMSSLITYLFHKFNIKIRMVTPYNHQSLQAEHGIKSVSHILTKHLTRPQTNVDKIFVTSNICIQHI